jgi:predicted nuclease of predicted toxin-antitoxin system
VTFLLDLNIPISWVLRFEQAGLRAVHWSSRFAQMICGLTRQD